MDNILLLEAVLLSLLMCAQTAISATILTMILWCMDNEAALKCNGYKLNLHWQNTLNQRVYIEGGTRYENVQGGA